MRKSFSIIPIFFSLMINLSCGQEQKKTTSEDMEKQTFTNDLIHESSPYLLQHAHNPVNWHAWGDAALKKAKDENKMLIISVGYAACHWCHVMEHESFEDTVVARLMNAHFVCIKVDREERPDVDQVYMNAAQIMTGRGGWPLNALAMSDGKPFFAGTYFPKDKWMKVLQHFIDLKKTNPKSLIDQAEKVTQGIHSVENVGFNASEVSFSMKNLNKGFTAWKGNIDFKKGGGNRAPKFPMPSIWEYVLHYSYLSNDKDALRAVTTTLDNMAFGGIYDQLGGGFSRYSTDVDWHVPHFEKMLYDNAQLVSLYTHAWQATKTPLYKDIVYETLGFIEREMTSKNGGFYSSLDADSEGEEGKFYVWNKTEIEDELKEKSKLFMDYYEVTSNGNWEYGKNILNRKQADTNFIKKHEITLEQLSAILSNGKNKLLKTRSKRIRPGLDDKILTAWNALMLKGYITAYRAFGEQKFLDAALKNARFLTENTISPSGEITRNFKNGKTSIHGFLDDYAFVTSAFIELYQATFDEKWLNKANDLTQYALDHFFDTTSGMFFYTHDAHSNLISRKMEVADNVIPSSNSEMAKNMFSLGHYYFNEAYIKKAKQMLKNVQKDVHNNIYFYSNWSILEAHFVRKPYEVAIIGKDFAIERQKVDQYYLPNVLLLGGEKEGQLQLMKNKLVKGQTTIYVCQEKACKLPVKKAESALRQISK